MAGGAAEQLGMDFLAPVMLDRTGPQDDAVPAVAAAPLARGAPTVRRVRLEVPEMQAMVDASDIAELGDAKVVKIIDDIRDAMLDGRFVENGDTLVRDFNGCTIDGRKRLIAAIKAGEPRTFVLVDNIDPEARFAIGDTPRGQRKQTRTGAAPEEAVTEPRLPSPEGFTDRDRDAATALFALARAASGYAGCLVGDGMTFEEASRAIAAGRPVAATAGVPAHLAALVHHLVHRVGPADAAARFMQAWRMPATARATAPGRMALDARSAEFARNPIAGLATCAMAWRMFRDGIAGNPFDARGSSHQTVAEHVAGLASAGPAPQATREGIAYAIETFTVEEMELHLARAGQPMEDMTPEDEADIAQLVADAVDEDGLRLTGEPRKFGSDGILVEGFREFAASVMARKPFRTVTARGFVPGYKPPSLPGRRQSYGHRMMAMGAIKPYDVASVLKMLACHNKNNRELEIGIQRHRIVHRHYPAVQRSCILAQQYEDAAPVKALASLHALASLETKRGADEFLSDFGRAHAGTLRPDRPRHRTVIAVHARLRASQKPPSAAPTGRETEEELTKRSAANSGSDDEQASKLCWLIQAWNAWRRDRAVVVFDDGPPNGFTKIDKTHDDRKAH